MKRMTVFLATLVIGLSWAATETKQRAATDEASRPASADTLMKAPVDLSQVSMTNPVKALADRVREHVNSQPLRFPNQHWVRGAYYAGLMAMYESTSDRAYLDDCMKWGKQIGRASCRERV